MLMASVDPSILIFFIGHFLLLNCATAEMPAPFWRELRLAETLLSGTDVVILQNLLRRSHFISFETEITGRYDKQTATAVKEYKEGNLIESELLVFDEITAVLVLKQLSYDGYKDDEVIPFGYKFKIFIPVHKNRSVETEGKLMDANGKVRFSFTVRAHGALNSKGKAINQFTTDGNTPTGLIECDLNSKEPIPKSFGPYPVVRAVKGIKGNAAIGKSANDTFLSDYRNGILIHTGEWKNWKPDEPMPNSNGCLHVHPDAMKKIDLILTEELNVTVNQNPFGKQPYPYRCQGLLSIQQIDRFPDVTFR